MDRKKFLDFMDMIDGGGAGQTGDRFQGGGLFSALANAVATPYGSEDDERMKAMMERRMSAGLIDRPQAPTPQVVRSAAPSSAPATTPLPQLRPDEGSDYPSMNMPAISGYTTPQEYSSSGMTPANVVPYQGSQAVPTFDDPSTPAMLDFFADNYIDPRTYAPDYQARRSYQNYLDYLNTGRYPNEPLGPNPRDVYAQMQGSMQRFR